MGCLHCMNVLGLRSNSVFAGGPGCQHKSEILPTRQTRFFFLYMIIPKNCSAFFFPSRPQDLAWIPENESSARPPEINKLTYAWQLARNSRGLRRSNLPSYAIECERAQSSSWRTLKVSKEIIKNRDNKTGIHFLVLAATTQSVPSLHLDK
jgi:hypothetical protein